MPALKDPNRVPDASTIRRWSSGLGRSQLAFSFLHQTLARVAYWLGIDSFIEVTSGATLVWRMAVDSEEQAREHNERLSLRIVGACFLELSTYIAYESISDLIGGKAPERSLAGIILASVSLIAMPILSRAKKKVGKELGSAAMQMPDKRTFACIYRAFCWQVCCSTRCWDGGASMRG